MATAAPAMTWLPLNVVIVDNDTGDSPSPYRARVLRAGVGLVLQSCLRVPLECMCKVAAIGRDLLLSQSARGGMTRC